MSFYLLTCLIIYLFIYLFSYFFFTYLFIYLFIDFIYLFTLFTLRCPWLNSLHCKYFDIRYGMMCVMSFYLLTCLIIYLFIYLFSFFFLLIYLFTSFFILVKESLAEEMIARFSLNKVCCSLLYTNIQPVVVGFNFFLFYYLSIARCCVVQFPPTFQWCFNPFNCFLQYCKSRTIAR